MWGWWCGVGAIALVAVGCAQRGPEPGTTTWPAAGEPEQTGIASWYGPGFHGRRTANGETFDQNELTAAHRVLPHGTRVLVTNLRNGREVEVRINDRGPFIGDRIIDLSYAAARRIGMIGPGTARVRLQVLTPLVAPDRVVRSGGAARAAAPRRSGDRAEPAAAADRSLFAEAPEHAPGAEPALAEEALEPLAVSGDPAPAPAVAATTRPAPAAGVGTAARGLEPSAAAGERRPRPVRDVARPAAAGPGFVVQVATFTDPGRAEHLRDVIGRRFPEAFVAPLDGDDQRYCVRLGPYPLREGAAAQGRRVNRLGYPAVVMELEGL